MSNYKVWAFDVLSNEEAILCIDSRSLFLVYSPAKNLRGSYQLSDAISVMLFGEFGLEIKYEGHHGFTKKYEFESTELRDDFGSRLRRASKKHEKIMQGILMEISIQKSFFLKYNYKNSKQSKKYCWFSPDLNEIRWAPSVTSKKFSKVSVFEIQNIMYGPWSKNFQKVKKRLDDKMPPNHLCLTIETYKKTIDLQAIDEKQVKIWLSCLHYIVQTKNIPIQNEFTINRFPFLYFRLKVSQVAHKLGLTFHTYLKLKLNKMIYNLNSTPTQVIGSKAPSSAGQNTSRLSQIQDKIKRSFVYHKRNSTLPIRPGSYDDKHAHNLSGQAPYAASMYTDRRSQLNEFSRHSSASNVSLHYPLSQRVEHPCSYSTNSTNQNYHQTTKNIEMEYGVDNRRVVTQHSMKRPAHLRSEQKSSESLPSQWSPNPHESGGHSGQPLSTMKHSILDKTTTTRNHTVKPQETSINLYFNMDGSKEISGVIPPNHIDAQTTAKILPDNLNLDFAKIGSPHGTHADSILPPPNNSQIMKPESIHFVSKKGSPIANFKEKEILINSEEGVNREGLDSFPEKENISPNSRIGRKGTVKPKLVPLNLKKALNPRIDLNGKNQELRSPTLEAGSFNKLDSDCLTDKDKIASIKPVTQITSFDDESPIRDRGVVHQSQHFTKPYFAIEKSLEKSAEKSYNQSIPKTQVETSGSQILKRKVKLTIDKNALKTKLLQALQSSHTPPTYNTGNSNMANQSFAYEVIPANLSIDISKIDVDLDTTTKSKVSFQEDKGENQFTSRFRGEDDSYSKKKEQNNGKQTEGGIQEKELTLARNLTLGGKSEKTQDLNDTSQKKSKFNLSLDTSLVNLENENISLKQQYDEVVKEKESYKDKCKQLEQDVAKLQVRAEDSRCLKLLQQNMQNELHKKDVYIQSLLKNIDSLTEERDSLINKMSEVIKQNQIFIEKENIYKKQVCEQSEKKTREVTKCQNVGEWLEDFNKKLTFDPAAFKRCHCEQQIEPQRTKEAIDKSQQDKEVYKRRIFSPQMAVDTTTTKPKNVKDEIIMLKEVGQLTELERERQFALQASHENRKLKQENSTMKKNLKSKLGYIKNLIDELKVEKEKLKAETEDNYQGFQEVWPHLLNIYEYQSSQNMTLEVKCFTLSKENQLLRAQLKKKIENGE